MSERIVIVGAGGQLGLALRRRLEQDGRGFLATRAAELNLKDPGLAARLAALEPTAVINAAAWTDVRRAEEGPNRQLVWEINCHGPRRLAERCAVVGVPFVHVSTDYVFDGAASEPYREDRRDQTPFRPTVRRSWTASARSTASTPMR